MYKVFIFNNNEEDSHNNRIVSEFRNKREFKIEIINSFSNNLIVANPIEALKYIVLNKISRRQKFFIFCQTQHTFPKSYDLTILKASIKKVLKLNADVLIGGAGRIENCIQITENLFWVNKIYEVQFFIVFNTFCDFLIREKIFERNLSSLYSLFELSNRKFLIYPFISSEYNHLSSKKEYSKSNVKNNYEVSLNTLKLLQKIKQYFLNFSNNSRLDYNQIDLFLPVYIINLKKRVERRMHILKQFEDKSEFNTSIIEACIDIKGNIGLWNSILKIIRIAVDNKEDFIILCEDDHTFTILKQELIRLILL